MQTVKDPPPRRQASDRVALGVALLVAFLLVGLTWAGLRPSPPPAPDDEARVVEIAYRVDPRDWPAGQLPTYCEIADQHKLGQEARAATLWLNRGKEPCAAKTARLSGDVVVRLAVWAPTNFSHCKAEAATCSGSTASESAIH